MHPSKKPLIGWFFIALGCLFTAIAAVALCRACYFVGTAERTTGVVVAIRQRTNSDMDAGITTSYAPTFTFRDEKGREHRIESTISVSDSPYRVGDVVPVLYFADDPQTATIGTFWYVWDAPAISGLTGTLALGIGLTIFLATDCRGTD